MEDKRLEEMVDFCVNQIFVTCQKFFNIQSGDIDPMDAYELDRVEGELAEIISRVLEKQRGCAYDN